MPKGVRSQGRAYALQVLYALDLNDRPSPAFEVDQIWRSFELDLGGDSIDFAAKLACAAREAVESLDEAISAVSRNWRLERMSRVDRNILRLATYELRESLDVPVKVVINEAVELAKMFGAEEAPSFVNGVLDRIAQQERKLSEG